MYKDIEIRFGARIECTEVLKSGWAGEIISIKLMDRINKYIIKTYNSSKNGIESIKHEWTGLEQLYNVGFPVPKPIFNDFTCEKPYMVMEQIEGQDFWTCYEGSLEEDKEQLLDSFVKVFFNLHALDISIVDTNLLNDSSITFIEREINEVKNISRENQWNYFEQVINWLENEKVAIVNHSLSIIHRDFHPWNTILNNDKNIYVIDLLWGIGDYRFDLAWTYTLMERSGFKEFSEAILNKYEELKKGKIKNFEYFKVLSTLRWLTNVMISLKTGENLNETRRKEFENFISPLIQKGIKSIQEITSIKIII